MKFKIVTLLTILLVNSLCADELKNQGAAYGAGKHADRQDLTQPVEVDQSKLISSLKKTNGHITLR